MLVVEAAGRCPPRPELLFGLLSRNGIPWDREPLSDPQLVISLAFPKCLLDQSVALSLGLPSLNDHDMISSKATGSCQHFLPQIFRKKFIQSMASTNLLDLTGANGDAGRFPAVNEAPGACQKSLRFGTARDSVGIIDFPANVVVTGRSGEAPNLPVVHDRRSDNGLLLSQGPPSRD